MQYASRHGCGRLHVAMSCISMTMFVRKVAHITCCDRSRAVAEANCGVSKPDNLDAL